MHPGKAFPPAPIVIPVILARLRSLNVEIDPSIVPIEFVNKYFWKKKAINQGIAVKIVYIPTLSVK